MPYIMNKLDHPLPQPFEMKEDEADEYADFQRRAHLQHSIPEKGLKALTRDERKKMESTRNKIRLASAPMWNGYPFEFAPFGKQGSILEVEDNVAHHLLTTNKLSLVLVTDDAQVPDGVRPVRRLTPKATDQRLPRLTKFDAVLDAKETGTPRGRDGQERMTKAIVGPGQVVPA